MNQAVAATGDERVENAKSSRVADISQKYERLGTILLLGVGPGVNLILVLLVGLVGTAWFTWFIDNARWVIYLGWLQWAADLVSWKVQLGGVRSVEGLVARTTGWLIVLSAIPAFIQIVGAALVPFNAKLKQTFSVLAAGVPGVALLYIGFRWMHLGLPLDDIQKSVLWSQVLFVAAGLVISLIVRSAVMAGRREIGVN